MSMIATAVKHMMAAGMAADAIVAAIEEMEENITPARSKGAERQARYRKRHEASHLTVSDASDASDALKESVSPEPLSKGIPTTKENPPKGGQKKGSPLAEDWSPSEAAMARVRERGLSDALIADQVEAMRLWADSNRNRPIARKADWDKAFVVWCLRWADEKHIAKPQPVATSAIRTSGIPASDAAIAKAVSNYRRSGDWPSQWGPTPDQPDTLVAAEILTSCGANFGPSMGAAA